MGNYKKDLENNILSEQIIISALTACEAVISKKAYLAKKWKNYYVCPGQTAGDSYTMECSQWMEYRKKLRESLLSKYSMKEIIQMTKGNTDKISQKDVIAIIKMLDSDNYIMR